MKHPPAVLLYLILALAGSLASAQQALPESLVASTKLALKKEMRDFVIAQEEYFTDHANYAASMRAISSVYKPRSGVAVSFVYASINSYSAIATSEAVPGLVCAVFIGSAAPPLGMGAEGEAVCREASVRNADPTLKLMTIVDRQRVGPGDSIRIQLELTNDSDSPKPLDFFAPCAVVLRLERIEAGRGAWAEQLCATDGGRTAGGSISFTLTPHASYRAVHVVDGVSEVSPRPSLKWRLPIGRYRASALLHESSGISLSSNAVTFEVCWSPEQVQMRQRRLDTLRMSKRMTDSALRAMELPGCAQEKP